MLPEIQQIFHFSVTSAYKDSLSPLGQSNIYLILEHIPLEFDFIVCKQLTRASHSGLNFMQKHKISLKWSDTGIGLFTCGKNMLTGNYKYLQIEHLHFGTF